MITYVFFVNVTGDSSDTQQEVENPGETFDYTVPEVHELLLTEDELTAREQTAITRVLENDMVFFRVYIENDDFTIFNKRHLLKEILIHDDVLSILDYDIESYEALLEHFIQVDLDTDTGIFDIQFTTGDEQLNFDLANAYYAALNSEEIEILTDRNLFFFDEPKTLTSSEEIESFVAETDVEPLNIMNIVYFIVGGSIFGLVFGFLASIVINIYKKQISIIYNLSLDNKDKVINLTRVRDSSEQKEDVIEAISYPPNVKRAVLMEEGSLDFDAIEDNEMNKNIDSYHHFNKIKPDASLDEVVLIVKINETSKKWYETQLTLIKGNNIPLKVVKI
ncbi:hypothetical protein AX762_11650 [Alkalibacterium sp. 20]|nr:hypothetical protein AX762_11650 [Alkalibacterium sp. 20]